MIISFQLLVKVKTCLLSSSVLPLLRQRCPSYIPWLIVSVIVDAINSQFRIGFAAYVVQEIHETMKPTLANTYATTAVIFPLIIF
jgi:hypothetical protein